MTLARPSFKYIRLAGEEDMLEYCLPGQIGSYRALPLENARSRYIRLVVRFFLGNERQSVCHETIHPDCRRENHLVIWAGCYFAAFIDNVHFPFFCRFYRQHAFPAISPSRAGLNDEKFLLERDGLFIIMNARAAV